MFKLITFITLKSPDCVTVTADIFILGLMTNFPKLSAFCLNRFSDPSPPTITMKNEIA